MKAAVVLAYGDKDPAIEFRTDLPKPVRREGKSELLLKVLTCATAAGDVHMLSGRVSLVLKPPAFPYIPGKDVCGIVEEADAGSKYKKGDCVVSSRDFLAHGGMAEYCVVEEARTHLKPPEVNNLQAAACADSAVTAMRAVEAANIKPGERVLVLGGSGGVGSCAVQLAKLASPSLLAATSTQEAMLKGLGVDEVINYTSTNWWEVEDYIATPFDVVIDIVGGNNHYTKSYKVLKSKRQGGRFIAVTGDIPVPVVKTVPQLLSFAFTMLKKPIWTSVAPGVPAYKTIMSSTTTEYLAKLLPLMQKGQLNIALEPAGPFPFTAEGVKAALALQASNHAHGKVVVQIAEQ